MNYTGVICQHLVRSFFEFQFRVGLKLVVLPNHLRQHHVLERKPNRLTRLTPDLHRLTSLPVTDKPQRRRLDTLPINIPHNFTHATLNTFRFDRCTPGRIKQIPNLPRPPSHQLVGGGLVAELHNMVVVENRIGLRYRVREHLKLSFVNQR
jgi:hypothetical protein